MKKLLTILFLFGLSLNLYSQTDIVKRQVTLDTIKARTDSIYLKDHLSGLNAKFDTVDADTYIGVAQVAGSNHNLQINRSSVLYGTDSLNFDGERFYVLNDTIDLDGVLKVSGGIIGQSTISAPGNDNEIIINDGGNFGTSENLEWNGTTLKLQSSVGTNNLFIGEESGSSIDPSGQMNLFIGYQAGKSTTVQSNNVFIGCVSGTNSTGLNNTFIGSISGNLTTTGDNNVFIGKEAGKSNTTGDGNIFIGHNAGSTLTVSNTLAIDNTSTSTPLIYGEFDNDIVKVNGNFNADTIMNYIYEETLAGDEGINIKGELHVGSYNDGKESVFGEGDSHVNGLKVFSTTDDVTYTDNTAAASSGSGSTYTVFNGTTTVGSADYFGSDSAICGVKLTTASLTDPGTGAVAREYWNGSAWVDFTTMATNANYPYESRADNIGTVVGSEQIRFGSCADQDTTTVNGVHGKYWFRLRITSAITSCGTVEQVKLHTNRYEINKDGKTEYFGIGIYESDIPLSLQTLSGATPSNESIAFASGLTLNYLENGFNNSAVDGYGGYVIIPEGLDSSKPLEFTCSYYVDGTATGDIEFQLDVVQITLGDTIDGTLPYQAQLTDIKTISTASDKILKTVTFEINVEDLVPGEGFAFKFYRDATAGNTDDTLAGDIVVLANRLVGKFWQP